MLSVVICGRDMQYAKKISSLIRNCVNNVSIDIQIYESGHEFLERLKNDKRCDWLILDMHVDGANGYDLAEAYRQVCPKGILFFCTHKINKPLESFCSEPVRVIIKDEDNNEKIVKYIKEAVKYVGNSDDKIYLLGYNQSEELKVYVEDIYFIENKKNEIVMHINREIYYYDDSEYIILEYELPELYSLLKEEGFEYGSDRYLINMDWVETIKNSKVTLKDGTRLQLSRSMRKKFLDRLSDKSIGL